MNSLFWQKQTSSIWFSDREIHSFREKTYTQNNSFMNHQQRYSFNQWHDWEEDTFLSTFLENNLAICYRLQNIAILLTERMQMPQSKKISLARPLFTGCDITFCWMIQTQKRCQESQSVLLRPWAPQIIPRPEMIPKLYRKWCRTANDPQCGPQMIPSENGNGMEFVSRIVVSIFNINRTKS